MKHGCIKPGSINNNRFFNKPNDQIDMSLNAMRGLFFETF